MIGHRCSTEGTRLSDRRKAHVIEVDDPSGMEDLLMTPLSSK